MSPGVLRKQAYLIWAEKTITPATLWASLPLSFSLLSFLFLPKVIPEIERKRLFAITSSSLNFRDDSCFLLPAPDVAEAPTAYPFRFCHPLPFGCLPTNNSYTQEWEKSFTRRMVPL